MGLLCSPLALALLAMTLLQGAQGSWKQAGCGQPRISGRIVGGGDAPRGRWPWQVSIQRNGQHFCGGSLISAQWVVSAAHCFQLSALFSSYRVNLGEYQLSDPSRCRISSPVSQIFVHPNYSSTWKSADIALLQLTEPVQYTNEILPVCLPGASLSFHDNHTCWVTGWGTTASAVSLPPPKTLQEVQVQLIDTAACNALYNIDLAPNIGRDPVKPDMICAGYAEGQRDSCQGDSGGPLACDHNGTWFLMGIVSWGYGCGQPNRPGVYVRTVSYGEWIREHVGSGSQASTMGNCTSGTNDARPCFSSFMLLFTTLLISL
ncbi:serine protease 27-like [Mauremys reevesii]|uniref:serine protease 27-like n=1 Tax=Mauremys reevesii TaxID=260615 RepID=UPI00193EE130|nr:serine protease 27-like [Mauremys reevesii]XP_039390238.1 serine protease 27-like [Mauremys reevesii]